ncbi:MAG TPA: TIM barrel protein, partial [Phycisphaeraceae bacterium]
LGTVPQVSADQPDEELTLHFRGAAAAGAPRVRVAPPAYPAQVFDYAQYLQKTREAYRRAVELARPHGVKIVIEMHCRTSATSPGLAYQIVQGFDPADLGVIPDLGNFSIEGAITPHLAVSVLRDWIDHCHIGGSRRVQSDYDEAGFRRTSHVMCPLAESELPIAAWLKALATLNRPIPLVIEDYTPNVPGRLRLTTSAQQAQRLLKCL